MHTVQVRWYVRQWHDGKLWWSVRSRWSREQFRETSRRYIRLWSVIRRIAKTSENHELPQPDVYVLLPGLVLIDLTVSYILNYRLFKRLLLVVVDLSHSRVLPRSISIHRIGSECSDVGGKHAQLDSQCGLQLISCRDRCCWTTLQAKDAGSSCFLPNPHNLADHFKRAMY